MTQKTTAVERLAKEKYNLTDEELAQREKLMSYLKEVFDAICSELPECEMLHFCKRDDTAFGVFICGILTMLAPTAGPNRDMFADRNNLDYVYGTLKNSLMDGLTSGFKTKAEDDFAKEVFHWGLLTGQHGIATGTMCAGTGN